MPALAIAKNLSNSVCDVCETCLLSNGQSPRQQKVFYTTNLDEKDKWNSELSVKVMETRGNTQNIVAKAVHFFSKFD